ncbi:MAG: phage major capsid protein, partial [Clostridiales bacterium]|nr:phage major capsid protein [Clostridiales bacterium]
IDTIMMHNDEDEEDAVIYSGEEITIAHAADDEENKETKEMAEPKKEKTVQEDLDELTEEQLQVVMGLIGAAAEGVKESDNEGDNEDMKHNVFENDNDYIEHADRDTYMSSEELSTILEDAKSNGSLKKTFFAHGITNIDYLFPDDKNLDTPPQYIKRDTDWVSGVMNGVHKTPFSRIRSTFANITGDEARARGYITGHQKVSEVLALLKRSTSPQTVYKMQKFDRDDIIDITDFDVISWIKTEMRMMLDEEIARAILVGDGREAGTEYSISHDHIRPIWTDDDLFTVKVPVAVEQSDSLAVRAKKTIQAIVRARKYYKGSGNPVFYTTEDTLTEMLLLEDLNQRIIYDTVDKLANALRVSKIVTVPVMENLTREVSGENRPLVGIIVNLNDYNVGADKGGAVNMFDDFDIDYNKYSYLIETRCSGALTKPYSAMAVELDFQ